MNPKEYSIKVKDTEPQKYNQCQERILYKDNIRLLHAAMGASTEAGELLDAIKKHVFYGKPLDKNNLLEETGDILWYLAILADATGFSLEEAMQKNINKLQARYQGKYSDNKALNRNLDQEYQTLQ